MQAAGTSVRPCGSGADRLLRSPFVRKPRALDCLVLQSHSRVFSRHARHALTDGGTCYHSSITYHDIAASRREVVCIQYIGSRVVRVDDISNTHVECEDGCPLFVGDLLKDRDRPSDLNFKSGGPNTTYQLDESIQGLSNVDQRRSEGVKKDSRLSTHVRSVGSQAAHWGVRRDLCHAGRTWNIPSTAYMGSELGLLSLEGFSNR